MGKWVLTEDRQPEAYGEYHVIRRVRGTKTMKDKYRWNGGYWVTPGGNPSYSVHAWWDKDAKED